MVSLISPRGSGIDHLHGLFETAAHAIERGPECAHLVRAPCAELGHIEVTGGYAVRIAQSGEDALKVLDSFNPDYLITDLRLPGMDGFSLVSSALEKKGALKCLVMSGAIEDVPPALAAKGISEHNLLQKPATLASIEERILSL